jgi:hypothetical protein
MAHQYLDLQTGVHVLTCLLALTVLCPSLGHCVQEHRQTDACVSSWCRLMHSTAPGCHQLPHYRAPNSLTCPASEPYITLSTHCPPRGVLRTQDNAKKVPELAITLLKQTDADVQVQVSCMMQGLPAAVHPLTCPASASYITLSTHRASSMHTGSPTLSLCVMRTVVACRRR